MSVLQAYSVNRTTTITFKKKSSRVQGKMIAYFVDEKLAGVTNYKDAEHEAYLQRDINHHARGVIILPFLKHVYSIFSKKKEVEAGNVIVRLRMFVYL